MRVSFVNQQRLLENLKNLGLYPKTVLDVGVANGTPWLYAAFPASYFYLFEPVPTFDSAIGAILQTIRGEHVKVALGSKCGKMDFFIPEDVNRHQIATACYSPAEVPAEAKHHIDVVTLDSYVSGLELPSPIFLKTDVQGLDLEVAKGAVATLPKIDFVICETPMYGPWGGGNDFKDYVDFYYANNFILYDIVEPLRRPDDDRLHSIDLCFANLRTPIAERNLYTSGKETLKRARRFYSDPRSI